MVICRGIDPSIWMRSYTADKYLGGHNCNSAHTHNLMVSETIMRMICDAYKERQLLDNLVRTIIHDKYYTFT